MRRNRVLTSLLVAAALAASVVGCSRSKGSTEAFCTQVRKVPSLESVLARFSEVDTDVLSDRIDKARTAYHALADAAPSSIDTETDEVVSLVDDILDAVEANPSDPAKAADQLRAAMAGHQGIAKDRTKVAAFAEDNCKVQLDPTLTDGGATTTSEPAATTTTG